MQGLNIYYPELYYIKCPEGALNMTDFWSNLPIILVTHTSIKWVSKLKILFSLQGETRRCNSIMENAALRQNEVTYITDSIPLCTFHALSPTPHPWNQKLLVKERDVFCHQYWHTMDKRTLPECMIWLYSHSLLCI